MTSVARLRPVSVSSRCRSPETTTSPSRSILPMVWDTVGPEWRRRSAIRARRATMFSSSSSRMVLRYISVVSIRSVIQLSSSSAVPCVVPPYRLFPRRSPGKSLAYFDLVRIGPAASGVSLAGHWRRPLPPPCALQAELVEVCTAAMAGSRPPTTRTTAFVPAEWSTCERHQHHDSRQPPAPGRAFRGRPLQGAAGTDRCPVRRVEDYPRHIPPAGPGQEPGGLRPRRTQPVLPCSRGLRGGPRRGRLHRILGYRQLRPRFEEGPAPVLRRVWFQVCLRHQQ